MAIIHVELRQPAPPVKNWRILLVQSFTARMSLLTATSAFEKTLDFLTNSVIFPVSPQK